MAPLDATSCWVLGQTASQQRRSFCHLQVVGGGTRHQPSVGHHKRWRVSIPVIHWFVQVCRGWERVLAQRIPFIFDFAMYIEIKDEISHSVQRFSVKCGCVWHLFSEVPLLLRAVSAGGEVAVMSWLLVTKLRTCGKLSTLIIWTLQQTTWHHLTVYYVQQNSHLYVFIDRWHTNLSAAVGLRH